MGLRCGWISRPARQLRRLDDQEPRPGGGLDISDVVWVPYDGVGRADRVGLNFTEVGTGVRGSVTMYDRGHSAASHMKPGEVDWKKVFSKGVRWFHTGGIFSALSPSCAEVRLEALKAAHEAGVVTSYDLNFRSKLWSAKEANAATQKLIPYIKVLIGNEEDFIKVLGMKIEGVKEDFRGLEVDSYKTMVEQVVKKYPTVEGIGTTLPRGRERPRQPLERDLLVRGQVLREPEVREPRDRGPRRAAATASPAASSTACSRARDRRRRSSTARRTGRSRSRPAATPRW
jgi:2-dehydro-3-deoxygluconokinase